MTMGSPVPVQAAADDSGDTPFGSGTYQSGPR